MSSFDLRGDGKVALVTGGASGIGRTVAEVFAEAGYRLVIVDRDADAGERARAELEDAGHEVELALADVADEGQVAAAVERAVERFERLDFVLNNAGIVGHGAPIENLDPEDLERVLAVDLKAPFFVCKHVVPVMKAGGGGSIVNVASITAASGSAYFTAYGAAKAGVIALTRGLARNLGRFNIRINCLNPGSIAGTDLMSDFYDGRPEVKRQDAMSLIKKIPLGRPGQPRDVAHLALFLASPLAAHVHGAVLTLDGGENLGYH